MPYYIYRVSQLGPIKQLEKLTQLAGFKEASAEAKRLRKEADLTRCKIQVVFGENELQAEEALHSVREPEPMTGDDY
jgi:dihydrodipicolinate synthase/N-acetylneuraminate lyase